VARILNAMTRCNPCGKRDYAIILLIARRGLLGVDRQRLEFADFDVLQPLVSVRSMTGHRVRCRLLKDVAGAVIDYIPMGLAGLRLPAGVLRPPCPIGPFSDQDHLHQILVSTSGGLMCGGDEKRRHGMPSLWASHLATRWM